MADDKQIQQWSEDGTINQAQAKKMLVGRRIEELIIYFYHNIIINI